MLAWSGPSVVTALAARRLPVAWSGRARMSAALVVIGAGQLLLWHIVPGDGAARFVPGLLVAGVGSGVLNAALGRESVASVPAGQGGLGSGANNTARYLGSALGVTIVSVVAAPVRRGDRRDASSTAGTAPPWSPRRSRWSAPSPCCTWAGDRPRWRPRPQLSRPCGPTPPDWADRFVALGAGS